MSNQLTVYLGEDGDFDVDFEYQPYEEATFTYPGCPEGIEINFTTPPTNDRSLLQRIEDALWDTIQDIKREEGLL